MYVDNMIKLYAFFITALCYVIVVLYITKLLKFHVDEISI